MMPGFAMHAPAARLRAAARAEYEQARADMLADGIPAPVAETCAAARAKAYLRGAADSARATLDDAARRNAASADAAHCTFDLSPDHAALALRLDGEIDPAPPARAAPHDIKGKLARLFGGHAA